MLLCSEQLKDSSIEWGSRCQDNSKNRMERQWGVTFYIQVRVNQFNMAAILRRRTQILNSGSNKRKVITVGHPQVCCSMSDLCLLRVVNYGKARVGRAREKQKIFKRWGSSSKQLFLIFIRYKNLHLYHTITSYHEFLNRKGEFCRESRIEIYLWSHLR